MVEETNQCGGIITQGDQSQSTTESRRRPDLVEWLRKLPGTQR
jgi:hypothetical protein